MVNMLKETTQSGKEVWYEEFTFYFFTYQYGTGQKNILVITCCKNYVKNNIFTKIYKKKTFYKI